VVDKRKLNQQERDMLRSELAIMKLLHHPNVISLKEVFDTKTAMYITMEFVEGGELFAFVMRSKKLSEY
jgi:serine/threonine protein kinase